jgi:phage tail sheath protein FI
VPVTPTYPGVYIEELESGVHPITGVATSITAFLGFAPRGPVDTPTTVQSFTEYGRVFGGLHATSTMSYAVQHFFANGGQNAIIVRCTTKAPPANAAAKSSGTKAGPPAASAITLEAASEGVWGDDLRFRVDHAAADPTTQFNITIKNQVTGELEVLRNLLPGATLPAAIAAQSQLVRLKGTAPTTRPGDHAATTIPKPDPFDPSDPTRFTALTTGKNGTVASAAFIPATPNGTGIHALERADLFNLLVIPPIAHAWETAGERVLPDATKGSAAAFCRAHRAFFLVDPHPDWDQPSDLTGAGPTPPNLTDYISDISKPDRRNAALYVPYLRAADPLQGGVSVEFPPAGTIAGVLANTDAERGVWKAPAGLDAGLSGVSELKVKLTDGENGILNPLGVNCLRTFAAAGHVVWGARTLDGNDILASEWKYVPVRRTALFLEESLFRGTQWVVFEPNGEPLWAQIRLNVGAFMHDLFRKGAFQGTTPREAYLVKCDKETTTQVDINNGVVNILVGFAPLKPAEFVIVQIQQLAGQIES